MFQTVGQAVRRFAVCAFLCVPLCAAAQDKTAKPPVKPETGSKVEPAPQKDDGSIEITRKDGRKVSVPRELLEEFLDWKNLGISVNSVALEGTAGETRAKLTATITLQVLNDNDDTWHRVPLYLNEAVILVGTKHEYFGERIDGRPRPGGRAAYSDRTPESGYRWWFRGHGFHRLTLKLSVPIAKTVAQRRLRLQLPRSAASTIKLRVPDANLDVVEDKDKDTVSRTRRVGRNASEIEVTGLGSELDLKWHSVPGTQNRAILQSLTSMFVDFTVESVVLTAVQKVQPLGGSIERFEVQLPKGFQIRAVTGPLVKPKDYRVDSRNRVTVELSDALIKTTEVKWTLDRPLPAGDTQLPLDGFDVTGGRLQQGQIAVARVQGLRVAKSDAGSGVPQIRADRFSEPDLIRGKPLSGVYQFFRQPFRLNLSVSRVRPHITVQPAMRLQFDESTLRLTAKFRVTVSEEGAAVDSLKIEWPDRKSSGWTIAPLTAAPLIDSALKVNDDTAPITLKLAGRQSGEFDVVLSAERPLADHSAAFRLPVLKADVTRPTGIVVERTTNVEVDLADGDNQPLPVAAAAKGDRQSTRRYRLDGPDTLLTAKTTVHKQRISATTRIDLRPSTGSVGWSQKIALNVQYVPLSRVRFEVPAQLAGGVKFLAPDERRVTATETVTKSGRRVVEFELRKPATGTIEFQTGEVALSAELQAGQTVPFSLPMIRLEGTVFSEIQVHGESRSRVEFQLPVDSWRRMSTLDGSPAWVTTAPPESTTVTLHYPEVPRTRAFAVRRAFVRVAIDAGGAARCRGQYRVVRAPESIVVTLPEGLQLDAVWWDKTRVEDVAVAQTSDGTVAQVPLGGAQSEGLLTIDCHSTDVAASGWLVSRKLSAPRFPQNVGIEETAWEVALPADQHLSSYSAAFFGEFRWIRNVAFWEREPTAAFAHPGAWIGEGDGPRWNGPDDANVYAFRRYEAAPALVLTTMSRSLIVLLGAGIAWLTGVLLLRFRRLRGGTVLLTAALLAAVAGLWFGTELQLLCQPALLGMLLVGGYVWIDRVVNRRRGPAVITVADPSEFVVKSTEPRQQSTASSEPAADGPTMVRGPQPVSDVRRPG